MAVRKEKNISSLKNLEENLAIYHKDLYKIPIVMQYNKRDLGQKGVPLLSYAELEEDLNSKLKAPRFGASAMTGHDVVATLKKAIQITMISLKRTLM